MTKLPPKTKGSFPRPDRTSRTRQKIQDAAAALLDDQGSAESITFRAVAERAGVTEMTVYRHFPTRDELLRGLWAHLNRRMGPSISMPTSEQALRAQHLDLFTGFDRIAPQIIASITTPQGREMRGALDKERRKAFMSIVNDVAPSLDASTRKRAAAVIQLLHSAYAWASLREQWNLSGAEAGQATNWAIDILLNNLRTRS